MNYVFEMIRKSAGASLLISLGSYVLLKVGNPFGPILFALGLLSVCYMGQNLFTGKCGFIFKDKIKLWEILLILGVNLIVGYILGFIYSYADSDVFNNAAAKVLTWEVSTAFFIKSILCGIVMYIAVYIYKKGSNLGILLGVPLFIFAGFQHSIANAITLGASRMWHWSIIICVLGNFIGSLFIYYLSKENKND